MIEDAATNRSAGDDVDSTLPATASSLYRTVWRWHFFAGIAVGPLLTVLAVTGGLYAFKYELEGWWYADLLRVAPLSQEAPADENIAAAMAALPPGWSVDQIEIDADPARSWGVATHGPDGSHRRLYVNQYTGEALGEIAPGSFFPVVIKLHRDLFAGSFGRIVVELATSWSIALLITGTYLWWPRAAKQNRAIWRPRWRGPLYLRLRDLHSVVGAWVCPIALLMAATGLMYSTVWGSAFQAASFASGAYDLVLQPISLPAGPDAASNSWEKVRSATRDATRGMNVSLLPVVSEDTAHIILAGGPLGPSYALAIAVNGQTGDIIKSWDLGDLPTLAQWGSWNYPLHTGTVGGIATKTLWTIAAVGLALLPITGAWMWWKRRPPGRLGTPRRSEAPVSVALRTIVALTLLILPVAGMSFAACYGLDRMLQRSSRSRQHD